MNMEQHLKERYLNTNLHTVWTDPVENVATFPLWNLSGQMVGFQQYRPSASKIAQNHPRDGRYFTWLKSKGLAVWGLERFHLTPVIQFVTEGVFDAARLTCRGMSAVAVLTNSPTRDLRNWFDCTGRLIVTVCDNDAAGKRLAKFGDVAFFTQNKDLGESSEDFVTDLLKEAFRYL